jgi:hypothetical protein
VEVLEVTGDVFRDVVSGTSPADVSGVVDAGAIYVWKGGTGLSGTKDPSATLTVPGAKTNDRLGLPEIRFANVAGDGALDVIASAVGADVGGTTDVGAVYVWEGGSSLSGSLPPSATLTVPFAVAFDLLGLASGQGVQIADVTGEGALDVVVGARVADVGFVNVGAIYVWKGGPTLSGPLAPFATLTVPGAVTDDRLGTAIGEGFYLADLDDNNLLDIVGVAQLADSPLAVQDVGAIYFWPGGAGLDTATPTTLSVPGAQAFDQLGR